MTDKVVCRICPHACSLKEGEIGACHSRCVRDGQIVAENYGRVTSLALDPIEKKPLAEYRPGSRILSVGSYGCNLHCPFCQNASIAQVGADGVSWRVITPAELAETAQSLVPRGNVGVAYTYNEPLVGYEFLLDCGKAVHDKGLVNVLVSNGTINPAPLHELAPLIDAANIDLKGFSDRFYDMVGGQLQTTMHTVEVLAKLPTCHLEVTTLVIPGENDSPAEIDAIASWLASLDPSIPYHLTRFFPCYHMTDKPATPVRTIYELVSVARKHLSSVYPGNC